MRQDLVSIRPAAAGPRARTSAYDRHMRESRRRAWPVTTRAAQANARHLGVAAGGASAGLFLFAGAVVLEHLLEPGLSVGNHMVSEYATSSTGPVMTCGFAAWASSILLTAWALRRRRMLAGCLAVSATGGLLLAAFDTQTVAGQLPPGIERDLGGRLHDAGGELVLVGLAFSCLLCAVRPSGAHHVRRTATCVLAFSVLVMLVAWALGDPAPGLRQRVLLATGVVWQAGLIGEARSAG